MDKPVVEWRQCSVQGCPNRTLFVVKPDGCNPYPTPVCVPHDVELTKRELSSIPVTVNKAVMFYANKFRGSRK